MLQFLKFTLASIFGLILSLLLLFFIVYLFIPSDKVNIADKAVLKLDLRKPIIERSNDTPLDEVPIAPSAGGIGILDLKKGIEKAKANKNIKGIFLNLSGLSAGSANMEELRNALLDFKKSKKFIYAYSEGYSEGAYYLASVADEIFLNPEGSLEFNGLTANLSFYKNMLTKLDVKPEVFRVGDFKSAVEPYIREDMSEANREQFTSFLNSIYDHYLNNIAKVRKISAQELERLSDEFLIRTPEDALKYKLITKIAYYDEVETAISKKLKLKKDKKINFVSLSDVKKSESEEDEESGTKRITVIVAEGEIRSGESSDGVIGSETIAREIRKARKDKKVKAIVLRINSPGGSALASDVMWREVMLAKKEKPVIASMSDLAASGGYYMAMACDEIYAQPTTITGSIGIFAVFFNVSELYRERLGITNDYVTTGNFKDIRSALIERDFTEEEREIIQGFIDEGYEDFTGKAAKGRNMSLEALKKVASGRVWTGIQAKKRGLVDKLGGIDDAIAGAAKKAKLKKDDYYVVYRPVQKDFFTQLMEDLGVNAKQNVAKQELGEFYHYLKILECLKSRDYMQARLPYDLQIH